MFLHDSCGLASFNGMRLRWPSGTGQDITTMSDRKMRWASPTPAIYTHMIEMEGSVHKRGLSTIFPRPTIANPFCWPFRASQSKKPHMLFVSCAGTKIILLDRAVNARRPLGHLLGLHPENSPTKWRPGIWPVEILEGNTGRRPSLRPWGLGIFSR